MTQPTDQELIQAVDRFFQRQRLMRRKLEIEDNLAETQLLIDELAIKAQLELDDVEILKQDGLPKLFFKLRGKLDSKLQKEEDELEAALSKLDHAQESLKLLISKKEQIQVELEELADASQTLQLFAISAKDHTQDETEQLAFEIAQTYLRLNESEEKIAFGEYVEQELKNAQQEIRLAQIPGPLASLNADTKMKNALRLLDNAEESLEVFDSRFLENLKKIRNTVSYIQKSRISPNLDLLVTTGGFVASMNIPILLIAVGGTSQTRPMNLGELRLEIENLRRGILKQIKVLRESHSLIQAKVIEFEKQWSH